MRSASARLSAMGSARAAPEVPSSGATRGRAAALARTTPSQREVERLRRRAAVVSPLVTGFTTGWEARAVGRRQAIPRARPGAGLSGFAPSAARRYGRRMSEDYRVEQDSMGEVRVPAQAKWSAQTQRAVENFPISGMRIERSLVSALAAIKGASALVNARLKLVDRDVAQAIHEAAAEVGAGRWDDQFPVDVFQTGSGTSSNMNMNEVLATVAGERLGRKVHPNDDVNASQSSNDVFPSAIHVAATVGLVRDLTPALEHLARALRRKQRPFRHVVKAGRTHLMDATPVTLGQEFGGYAAAVEHGVERIQACVPRVAELPLGGTAVGTGINAPKSFAKSVIARVSDELGVAFTEARDHFEAQGARDGI